MCFVQAGDTALTLKSKSCNVNVELVVSLESLVVSLESSGISTHVLEITFGEMLRVL